ncbi:hypothetical protein MXE38_09415 [Anaerobiospirillum sp. NML120448]|uniref:hypothetical protein n=1 Tax=Anaerobiospirillum sp. NML120448 TaxID=2932816 RepID=UPI001FF0F02A|nr:hypothetical protein [Anaerobiospirillum sp. NML120448]MCK0515056.1 hypothetical protein [Anaerobiospirillum sp. NML120448]
MKWTIAQEVILARKLDLGLYDDLFDHLFNYLNNGSDQAKLALQELFVQYNLNVDFTSASNKQFDYKLMSAIRSLLQTDSALTLFKLIEGTDLLENSNSLTALQHAQFNEFSVAQLCEIDSIVDKSGLLNSEDFKNFVSTLQLDKTSVCEPFQIESACFKNFDPGSFYNHYLAGPQEADSVKFKFSKLTLTVASYLNPDKAKANQNKATSAHKNRVKKNKHKAANKNQVAAKELKVPTGYRFKDDLPFSYFQPSNDSDFGFNLLKNIDLFGLHLILVAQRRKYYFISSNYSEFRSNFQALDSLSCDAIVHLHNNATVACDKYQQAYTAANTDANWENRINLYKAYIKRNAALMEYADYYQELFANLMVYQKQISEYKFWIDASQYFNYNDIYNTLLAVYTDTTSDNVLLLLFGRELNKSIQALKGLDTQTIKKINSLAPMTVYSAGAFFSSTFDSVADTHPMKVNFEPMVNTVLSYYKNIDYSPMALPVPIEDAPFKDSNDFVAYLQFAKDNPYVSDEDNQLALIIEKDMKIDKHQSDYLMIFAYTCMIMDFIHRYVLDLLYLDTYSKGNPCLFNWFTFNDDDFEAIYPQYQQILDSQLITDLHSSHNKLMEQIILFQDLIGASDELYTDKYFALMLKLTGNYDKELASAIANGNYAPSDHTISAKDQILIDKVCTNFLKEIKVFMTHVRAFYDHPFPVLNELLNKVPESCKQRFRVKGLYTNTLALAIDNLSRILVSEFKTVPSDLSNLKDEHEISSLELKHKYYASVHDVLTNVYNRKLNKVIACYLPHWCYLGQENFKKFWPYTGAYCPDTDVVRGNLIGLLSIVRSYYVNDSLNKDDIKVLLSNRCVANSICIGLSTSIKCIVESIFSSLIIVFFKFIDSSQKRFLEDNEVDVAYLVYILKQAQTIPLLDSKVSVLSSTTNNDLDLATSEIFKELLQTALSLLKPIAHFVVTNIAWDEFNYLLKDNYVLCNARAIEHLLRDPYDFISNCNIEHFNEIVKSINDEEAQEIVSVHPDYSPYCFKLSPAVNETKHFGLLENCDRLANLFWDPKITELLLTEPRQQLLMSAHEHLGANFIHMIKMYECDRDNLNWVLHNCNDLSSDIVNEQMKSIDLSEDGYSYQAYLNSNFKNKFHSSDESSESEQHINDSIDDMLDIGFSKYIHNILSNVVNQGHSKAQLNMILCYLGSTLNTLLRNIEHALKHDLSSKQFAKLMAQAQKDLDQTFIIDKDLRQIRNAVPLLQHACFNSFNTIMSASDNNYAFNRLLKAHTFTLEMCIEKALNQMDIDAIPDFFDVLLKNRSYTIANMSQDQLNSFNFAVTLDEYLYSEYNTYSVDENLQYIDTLIRVNMLVEAFIDDEFIDSLSDLTRDEFLHIVEMMTNKACTEFTSPHLTSILSIPQYKQIIDMNIYALLNAYDMSHDNVGPIPVSIMPVLIITEFSVCSVKYEICHSDKHKAIKAISEKMQKFAALDPNDYITNDEVEDVNFAIKHIKYKAASESPAIQLLLQYDSFDDVINHFTKGFPAKSKAKTTRSKVKKATAPVEPIDAKVELETEAKPKAKTTRSKAKKAATSVEPTETKVEVETEAKPKAKTTRSKAKKAEAPVEPTEVKVEAETETKPKAKATRSKVKKAATPVEPIEAKVEGETEAKPKAKTTRSKAKKTEAPVEPTEAKVEVETEAKPKSKTTRSKAKKSEAPVESIEAIVEVETEAKPKSKTTRSKAKKAEAPVEPIETKVEMETKAKPKAKTSRSKVKKAEATVEPIEAKVEVETEAKPKAKTTRSKAKKAAVEPIEAKVEVETEAKPKAKTSRSKVKKAETPVEPIEAKVEVKTEAKPKAKTTRSSKAKKAEA